MRLAAYKKQMDEVFNLPEVVDNDYFNPKYLVQPRSICMHKLFEIARQDENLSIYDLVELVEYTRKKRMVE